MLCDRKEAADQEIEEVLDTCQSGERGGGWARLLSCNYIELVCVSSAVMISVIYYMQMSGHFSHHKSGNQCKTCHLPFIVSLFMSRKLPVTRDKTFLSQVFKDVSMKTRLCC